MTTDIDDQFCDCQICPCNVPTDGWNDCKDCRSGYHFDDNGFRVQGSDFDDNEDFDGG